MRSVDAPDRAHAADSRKVALELSLARMRADLERAHVVAHRAMIERAIATLETELASFAPRS